MYVRELGEKPLETFRPAFCISNIHKKGKPPKFEHRPKPIGLRGCAIGSVANPASACKRVSRKIRAANLRNSPLSLLMIGKNYLKHLAMALGRIRESCNA